MGARREAGNPRRREASALIRVLTPCHSRPRHVDDAFTKRSIHRLFGGGGTLPPPPPPRPRPPRPRPRPRPPRPRPSPLPPSSSPTRTSRIPRCMSSAPFADDAAAFFSHPSPPPPRPTPPFGSPAGLGGGGRGADVGTPKSVARTPGASAMPSPSPSSMRPPLNRCRRIASSNRARCERSAATSSRLRRSPGSRRDSSPRFALASVSSSSSSRTCRTSSPSMGTRHTGHRCVGARAASSDPTGCLGPLARSSASAAAVFHRHQSRKHAVWKQW